MKVCSVENCNRKARAKGLCTKHYTKQYRCGSPLAGREYNSYKKGFCSIEGCKEKYHSSGLCKKHFYQDEKVREVVRKSRAKYHQTEHGKEARKRDSQAYRAQKRGAKIENFKNHEIFERDNWVCGICGKSVDKYLEYPDPLSSSLDHIIPLSKGGTHTKNNVQLAHLRCNKQKGARNVQHLSPQV